MAEKTDLLGTLNPIFYIVLIGSCIFSILSIPILCFYGLPISLCSLPIIGSLVGISLIIGCLSIIQEYKEFMKLRGNGY